MQATQPLDPQALQLNQKLKAEAPAVYEMLSPFGKGLYYPKQGLLLQAEEAANSRYNATVGIALDDDAKPMHYKRMAELVKLDPKECITYASSYGLPPLRQLWREQILQKNPELQKGAELSLPVVTSGITHGLWIALNMFLSPGEELLLPKLYWPNYRLIAQNSCGARLKHYNSFTGQGLDLTAIQNELQAPGQKKVFLFNFPHNPTGYSPQKHEVTELQKLFLDTAEQGKNITILCDDAYWGLCYEEGTETQSLFAFMAGLHPRILAVKLDGATKEDFAWGLRIGFISFGLSPSTQTNIEANTSTNTAAQALEEKAGAAVRLSTSNSSRLSQKLLLATYASPETQRERQELQQIIAVRYRKTKECLKEHKYLKPLPFNSGYFMTFELQHQELDTDTLRKYILQKYDIGLIALQDKYLRFTFAAVAEKDIAQILQTIYQACTELCEAQSNPEQN